MLTFIRQRWLSLPLLVRFMLTHAATGVAIGWALLLVAIRVDLGGLGSLLSSSPDGPLATILLLAVFAITFGAAAIGVAVMSLPWDRGDRD